MVVLTPVDIPHIKEITVSVTIADKEYGNGTEAFHCLKADYPNGVPVTEIDDVISHGLDMYFSSWKTLMGARWATGKINNEEFKDVLTKVELRLEKVRKFLRKEITEK